MPPFPGMRRLLPLLPKPSHFAGCEVGAVRKDPAQVRGRVALAFPDLYEVGMSYTGQTLLYHAVNQRPELWAERVYAPTPEAAEVLRSQGGRLCTLESDTPLAALDLLGFHLTHELCYTNVLYMLDLAGIPLRAADRKPELPLSGPLVIAGGGCTLNAEPLAAFLDAMVLGDGEEILPLLLERVAAAKEQGRTRNDILYELKDIPGVYVPAFFRDAGPGQPLEPVYDDYRRVERRLLSDLDAVSYPVSQPQAFGAVHDRYTIEIARGCTRGCRFCQAGMIYRPVRERSLATLDAVLEQGLTATGYSEVSFLALSAGDFSGLDALFRQSLTRCRNDQVSISLPSLRVGSISPAIMSHIAGIRRTGSTVAPEAGSQRLRDVINKGVTEKQLLDHAAALAQNGWQGIKLYFMIGLPTETFEDLDAILALCLAVEGAARHAGGRLNITAAISPFVPKAHTPFQWAQQLDLEQITERVQYLKDLFRPYKRLRLRWHMPEMSFLEGVFARGDRRLAELIECAYRNGALFSSWTDRLDLAPWREAMDACGVTPEDYLAARPVDGPLPWDHLASGVSKAFLKAEQLRGLKQLPTPDCRYDGCRGCGVCTLDGRASELERQAATCAIVPLLNFNSRDQVESQAPSLPVPAVVVADTQPKSGKPRPPARAPSLAVKAAHFRLWYAKCGPASFLSQLELQSVFERAFRRARLPLAFSQGFHPLPLLSFARALPVGVESQAEYLDLFLREPWDAKRVFTALTNQFPLGLDVVRVATLPPTGKQPQAVAETYRLTYLGLDDAAIEFHEIWRLFARHESFPWTRETKKGPRTLDIRPLFQAIDLEDDTERRSVLLLLDWRQDYANPLALVRAVMPEAPATDYALCKLEQHFANA